MIAVVDYGVGNLFSLMAALRLCGADAVLTAQPEDIEAASHVILPGVGAFGDAAARLREAGLWQPLLKKAASGAPMLGICLGMQLLFARSFEYGEHAGLALIPGDVVPLSGQVQPGTKVPHIGGNALTLRTIPGALVAHTPQGTHVYFVHSFAAQMGPYVTATAEYSVPVPAAVMHNNVMGCQFHPEKSGAAGLTILKDFFFVGGHV